MQARLGAAAHAALGRNETTPAYRVTDSGDALDTLIRLFLLQRPVPEILVDKAFPGLVSDMIKTELLVADGNDVRAAIDVRPYQDWWVVADLTPGLDGRRAPIRPDYVLGVAPASLSLVDLTVPVEVASALDVGTGCGVQALHLQSRAGRVVGTDVNPRALRMAALTAGLNQVSPDLATCEHWPYDVEQPLGAHVLDRLHRAESLPEDVRSLRLRTAADVAKERRGAPGTEDPETIVLRRRRGMRHGVRRNHPHADSRRLPGSRGG